MEPKVLLVFRERLLPASETFILAQAESLDAFRPVYFGLRQVQGLALPPDRILTVNEGGLTGRLREITVKLCGALAGMHRLRKLQPAIIHAHFGPDGVLALPLARRLGTPLVVTLHGFDITRDDIALRRGGFSYAKYVRQRGRLQNEARLFVAVSEFIKREAIKKGFPADKIVVHYTGIDCESFRADRNIARDPVVLFVGRLVHEKGCRDLITAMRSVQHRVPEARLVVIGDGPLRKSLELLARVDLHDVTFLGTQPSDVVRYWLNRSRVLSVPSLSEAFGMVFVEAQAMGVPVASYMTGGIPEAVGHGVTGLLAPTGDVGVLATG
jgi:colanic acid/amylovoran biosynthesis glycosyltransferase